MIRLASEADIPQIIALTDAVADLHGEARPDILKAHPRHISEEKLLKNLRSEAHLVIVSELDGVIAGAMLCTLRRLEGDIKFQDALVLSIEDTSVEKRYRKSGIGSALLQFDDALFLGENGYLPNPFRGFLGCAYFSTPDEMAGIVESAGLRILEHCAVDMELGHFCEKLQAWVRPN